MLTLQHPPQTASVMLPTLMDSSKKIEVCFGGVSPLGPRNGFTTCYGIFIPAANENLSVGIIIDNGTGIHNVMDFMAKRKPQRMILLQTHLHLDHLTGLRFNKYFFGALENTWCLITEHALAEMKMLVSPPFHPIDMTFINKSNVPSFEKYGVKIIHNELPHGSDISTGFRIEALGKVIVVATDCELRTTEEQYSFNQWSKDAHMIIIDMKYADNDSYKEGHGHNCPKLLIGTMRVRFQIPNSIRNSHLVLVHTDNAPTRELAMNLRLMMDQVTTAPEITAPKDGDILSL